MNQQEVPYNRVVLDYTGVINRYVRAAVARTDADVGDLKHETVYRDMVLPCFEFALTSNTMWFIARDVSELQFTPPTEDEELWKVRVWHRGDSDPNNYVMSPESIKRLIDDWLSRP